MDENFGDQSVNSIRLIWKPALRTMGISFGNSVGKYMHYCDYGHRFSEEGSQSKNENNNRDIVQPWLYCCSFLTHKIVKNLVAFCLIKARLSWPALVRCPAWLWSRFAVMNNPQYGRSFWATEDSILTRKECIELARVSWRMRHSMGGSCSMGLDSGQNTDEIIRLCCCWGTREGVWRVELVFLLARSPSLPR